MLEVDTMKAVENYVLGRECRLTNEGANGDLRDARSEPNLDLGCIPVT